MPIVLPPCVTTVVWGKLIGHLANRSVSSTPRSCAFGEKLHADLEEIPRSFGGKSCALFVVDDFSRCCWVRFLSRESHAADELLDIASLINSHYPTTVAGGSTVQVLRADSGGEFKSHALLQSLSDINSLLSRECSTAGCSAFANGVVERMIRTVTESARTSSLAMGAPPAALAESVRHSVYLHDRLPTKSNPNSAPPIKVAFPSEKPLNMECLRPFHAPVHVTKLPRELPRRNKADPRAFYGRFLGFTPGYKGHRVLVNGKVLHRADVFFDECSNGSA